MSPAELGTSQISAVLEWWEWASYVTTGLVAIGVVGEAIPELFKVPKRPRHRRIVKRVALIILVIGVAGEFVTLVETTSKSGILIARLRGEAEDAISTLEHTRKQLWPPTIPDDAFLGELEGNPIGTAEILYQPEDVRAYVLATNVYALLAKAKWTVSLPEPARPSNGPERSRMPSILGAGGGREGIWLVANVDGAFISGERGAAVNALYQALLKSRLVLSVTDADPSLPANVVRILVGPGPYVN